MKPFKYYLDVSELPARCRIAIYGAGSAGVKFKSDLDSKRQDVKVLYFVDSFKSGMIEHIPILHPSDIINIDIDEIVICSYKFGEIHKTLQDLGHENLAVYGAPQREIFSGSGLEPLESMGSDFDVAGMDVLKQSCTPMPCHLKTLFVQNDGAVFPCCKVRGWQQYIIGYVTDPDILDKIAQYDTICSCLGKRFRRKAPDETLGMELLNIEFSLKCQASCAMCCVDAPSWRGEYRFYRALGDLVSGLRPSSLLVQGGEVLVQPRTLRWLKDIKRIHETMSISIVTNGNVKTSLLPDVERIFEEMMISVVGFQPETYKKIMGMDIERMKDFARAVIGGKVPLTMKFLCTPINIHETALFLEWAVAIKPARILISDASVVKYVNMETPDSYWAKIFQRTAKDVKLMLKKYKQHLRRNSLTISFEPSIKILFSLTPEYLEENDLSDVVD